MKRGLTFRSAVASALLLAVVVAGFVVMAAAVVRLQDADESESHSVEAQSTANALLKSTLDLETGVRGFVVSGKERFLEPYEGALAAYPALARRLEAQTSDERRQHGRAVAIHRAIDDYVRTWAQPQIRQARTDLEAAQRAAAAGGGKRRVDAIRRQFAALDGEQQRIDAARTHRADTLGNVALALAFGGMAVCGLLVIGLALAVRRSVVAPIQGLARAVGRIGAGELSVRVPPGGTAEVRELIDGFNAMAESLEQQRIELENQKAELEAQHDEIERALRTVEEQRAHSELLRRFGDELAGASRADAVSEAALRAMGDVANAEMGALYLVDEREETYALAARRALAVEDLAPTVAPGEGLAGRALAERETIVVSYAEATLRLPALVGGRDAIHEVHLPLLHGERVIGVVSLGRAHDSPFTAAEFATLGQLAQRASVAAAEALSVRRLQVVAHELETLLASTDEGIFGMDVDGAITFVNRAALERTGYTRAELLGRNAHDVLHQTRLDEGLRVDDEVFRRKDGTSFPVEYSSYPLTDGDEVTGAVVVFVDISARKVAERQRDTQHAVTRVLAEAGSVEDTLPSLLAAVAEGLGWQLARSWAASADGSLRCVATYAADGYDSDTSVEGPALRAFEQREAVVAVDVAGRLSHAVAVPIRGLRGELLGVAEFFSETPMVEDGLLETLRSIGAQTAQYVERRRGEAETERMRQEFVATVSHELRTPLTSIDGWLQEVLTEDAGPLNEEQRRYLQTVKRNSDRLIRLVSDLLLAGQIETGKLALQLDDVDVAVVAREAAELVSASAAAKRIELAVDARAGFVVRGDRSRLMQLLDNLLANAVKFTPEDGRVSMRVDADDGLCRVTISDTGIGIPREDRARLFERFYRASSAAKHGIGGTGLGLSISKAIAESHGGTITLADTDGPGTTFVVELPLAVRAQEPLAGPRRS